MRTPAQFFSSALHEISFKERTLKSGGPSDASQSLARRAPVSPRAPAPPEPPRVSLCISASQYRRIPPLSPRRTFYLVFHLVFDGISPLPPAPILRFFRRPRSCIAASLYLCIPVSPLPWASAPPSLAPGCRRPFAQKIVLAIQQSRLTIASKRGYYPLRLCPHSRCSIVRPEGAGWLS